MKSAIQSQKWEMDALEQYSRRDNIKIFGIAEPAQNGEENTNQIVMDLGKKVGVAIFPGDISVSHRVRGGRPFWCNTYKGGHEYVFLYVIVTYGNF